MLVAIVKENKKVVFGVPEYDKIVVGKTSYLLKLMKYLGTAGGIPVFTTEQDVILDNKLKSKVMFRKFTEYEEYRDFVFHSEKFKNCMLLNKKLKPVSFEELSLGDYILTVSISELGNISGIVYRVTSIDSDWVFVKPAYALDAKDLKEFDEAIRTRFKEHFRKLILKELEKKS